MSNYGESATIKKPSSPQGFKFQAAEKLGTNGGTAQLRAQISD